MSQKVYPEHPFEFCLSLYIFSCFRIDHINGGIKCTLNDNNLLCWLSSYKISREIDDKMRKIKNKYDIDEQKKDENLKQLLREFVEVGEHIEARITEIQKGKRRVILSCLEEDMKNTRGDYEIPGNFVISFFFFFFFKMWRLGSWLHQKHF